MNCFKDKVLTIFAHGSLERVVYLSPFTGALKGTVTEGPSKGCYVGTSKSQRLPIQ